MTRCLCSIEFQMLHPDCPVHPERPTCPHVVFPPCEKCRAERPGEYLHGPEGHDHSVYVDGCRSTPERQAGALGALVETLRAIAKEPRLSTYNIPRLLLEAATALQQAEREKARLARIYDEFTNEVRQAVFPEGFAFGDHDEIVARCHWQVNERQQAEARHEREVSQLVRDRVPIITYTGVLQRAEAAEARAATLRAALERARDHERNEAIGLETPMGIMDCEHGGHEAHMHAALVLEHLIAAQ